MDSVATTGLYTAIMRAREANFGRWIMPPGYRDDPDSPHGYQRLSSEKMSS